MRVIMFGISLLIPAHWYAVGILSEHYLNVV